MRYLWEPRETDDLLDIYWSRAKQKIYEILIEAEGDTVYEIFTGAKGNRCSMRYLLEPSETEDL